ncbi:hypothetical protein ACFYO5_37845 [Streptomyces sp. NPDC006259]|uniref:8-oxoguanine DNA glycosylase OGG fold protein n=1 Tax=Streptomyces sp. NPDC006259 TaxID=3364740 RepID=UPI00369C3BAD
MSFSPAAPAAAAGRRGFAPSGRGLVLRAKAAYAGLQSLAPEFGPSFYTKFLYFVGKTVVSSTGPQPLVLDRVLARRLRSLAQTVGRENGHDPDGSTVWRVRGGATARSRRRLQCHGKCRPSCRNAAPRPGSS